MDLHALPANVQRRIALLLEEPQNAPVVVQSNDANNELDQCADHLKSAKAAGAHFRSIAEAFPGSEPSSGLCRRLQSPNGPLVLEEAFGADKLQVYPALPDGYYTQVSLFIQQMCCRHADQKPKSCLKVQSMLLWVGVGPWKPGKTHG